MLSELSIIIPLARSEPAISALLGLLAEHCSAAQVLCVQAGLLEDRRCQIGREQWLTCEPGRALQQNLGARHATGRWLWFLHADSVFDASAVLALAEFLKLAPRALGYFELRFGADGPVLTRVNAWAANWRSHIFGLPFGDQGFVLERTVFERLGGFDESAPFGEDHLLVWTAKRAGIRTRAIGAALTTSARKYKERGWLRTTAQHFRGTWLQAWQQWRKC